MMDILQNIIVQSGSTDTLKEHALETIGYICQDIVSCCFLWTCRAVIMSANNHLLIAILLLSFCLAFNSGAGASS